VKYGKDYQRRCRVIVYRGLPGSGKTHHAQNLVASSGAVLIENNQFWTPENPHVPYTDSPELWAELKAWVRARTFRAMYHGAAIVCLANCHINPKSFDWVWTLADELGYAVEVRKMHEEPTLQQMETWLERGKPGVTMDDMRRMARGWE
jgi:hypothetical protein